MLHPTEIYTRDKMNELAKKQGINVRGAQKNHVILLSK